MSSTSQVPMISPDFTSTKLVPQDQVDSAKRSGWDNAVKMQGPKGEMKWVPQAQVDSARTQQFAVLPQPGTQKMVTPKGEITYALPSEVQKFQESGHTAIQPDGNYRVMPLPGEDYRDTIARSRNVVKALGTEEQKRAEQAELSTDKSHLISPNPMKNPLIAAPLMGITGTGALTGAGETIGAAGEAIGSIPEVQYIMSNPKLYAEWLLKNPATAALGKKLLSYAVKGGAAYLGAKWLSKSGAIDFLLK